VVCVFDAQHTANQSLANALHESLFLHGGGRHHYDGVKNDKYSMLRNELNLGYL
jgi:hypothetical protein